MAASRLLRVVALLAGLCLHEAHAVRVRIQTVTIAGFAHHQGKAVWAQLREGDALTLTREAANAHDPLAVRIDWQGHALGYIPRDESGPVAGAMDAGKRLSARISRLRDHPNPRERIRIEVFVERPR